MIYLCLSAVSTILSVYDFTDYIAFCIVGIAILFLCRICFPKQI